MSGHTHSLLGSRMMDNNTLIVKVTGVTFEEEHRYIGFGDYGDVFTGVYKYSFIAGGNGFEVEGTIALKEELTKVQAEQRIEEMLSNAATQS